MFEFHNIGRLSGEEIDLVLERTNAENYEEDRLPTYDFSIFLAGTDVKVGGISLRVGFNENIYYGGHIGYSIDEDFRGSNFAAKACLMLRDLAISHGMCELTITCDPANIASNKTCQAIGAEWVETVNVPEYYDIFTAGEKQKCRYIWKLCSDL
jgi:tagatose 1,6-diphosphate aldolase